MAIARRARLGPKYQRMSGALLMGTGIFPMKRTLTIYQYESRASTECQRTVMTAVFPGVLVLARFRDGQNQKLEHQKDGHAYKFFEHAFTFLAGGL
jgi:hypothetical protein